MVGQRMRAGPPPAFALFLRHHQELKIVARNSLLLRGIAGAEDCATEATLCAHPARRWPVQSARTPSARRLSPPPPSTPFRSRQPFHCYRAAPSFPVGILPFVAAAAGCRSGGTCGGSIHSVELHIVRIAL